MAARHLTLARFLQFCTVLGLAAYRLWYGEDRNASPRSSSPPIAPRTAEELRAAPGRLEAEGGPVQGNVIQDSPPSYEALFLVSPYISTVSSGELACADQPFRLLPDFRR